MCIVDVDDTTADTQGCGCCGHILEFGKDDQEIIEHLKTNIRVTQRALRILGIDFQMFLKEMEDND